ncbi:MAG: hypothetical protein HOP08_18855 [Cyclobacteriaceae bacterium]|nr:hypothetical protein [Cyclobacteriaceae bacterium]
MKHILLICIAVLLFHNVKAQTLDEWFRQKKTQKKYLVQQIAALHVYLDYLKKGYTIVHNGLNTIENIKNGSFNLDRDFFSSLKNVNPAIRNTAKVADIIAFQIFISRELGRVYNFCSGNKHFTPEEIRYIAQVHTNMVFYCDASISELLTIIQPYKTEMTDDERIHRIDKIYDEMNDRCGFVRAFGGDVQVILMERAKEEKETELLRKNYETL